MNLLVKIEQLRVLSYFSFCPFEASIYGLLVFPEYGHTSSIHVHCDFGLPQESYAENPLCAGLMMSP